MALLVTVPAIAEEQPTEAIPVPEAPPTRPLTGTRRLTVYDRYETVLDAKVTGLYGHLASDYKPPVLMLTAFWNYKYPFGTMLGVTISAIPQPVKRTDDGTKKTFSTYYGGLHLGQELYSGEWARINLGVTGGRGTAFIKAEPLVGDKTSTKADYNVTEPYLAVTFIKYAKLDIGLIVSQRTATMLKPENKPLAEEISSPAYGFTFRSQRF
jgi:hypothetical protein